jgi:hypothetical protein
LNGDTVSTDYGIVHCRFVIVVAFAPSQNDVADHVPKVVPIKIV